MIDKCGFFIELYRFNKKFIGNANVNSFCKGKTTLQVSCLLETSHTTIFALKALDLYAKHLRLETCPWASSISRSRLSSSFGGKRG